MWINLNDEEVQRLSFLLERADPQLAKRIDYWIQAHRDPDRKKDVQDAKEQFQEDGELEFDDDAVVSYGEDPGAYVMSWTWLPFDETDPRYPQEKETEHV